MNIADHIAYDQPRVFINTQFVLRDVKPRAKYRGQRKRLFQYWATWQSGVLFANGQPKPSFQAFLMPFDVRLNGQTAQMWGQLRSSPTRRRATSTCNFARPARPDWQPAGGPFHVENTFGYWETQVPLARPGRTGARSSLSR